MIGLKTQQTKIYKLKYSSAKKKSVSITTVKNKVKSMTKNWLYEKINKIDKTLPE